jgi:hypothetical protein
MTRLTFYLRNLRILDNVDPDRVRLRVIEGDVLNTGRLKEAMAGTNVVHANPPAIFIKGEQGICELVWLLDGIRGPTGF